MPVFIVSAFCPGTNKEKYSYTVGVCDNLEAALQMAKAEEKSRSNMYVCEITEFTMNVDVWDAPKRKIKRT